MRPGTKAIVEHFSKSLTAFQASQDAFRVLCTAPHQGGLEPRRPAASIKKLIVLDSSYNPPTCAHAEMAKSAIKATGLQGTRLMLLLAVNNADKAPQPASFPQRLGMMEAFAYDLLDELRLWDGAEGEKKEEREEVKGDRLEIDLAVTTMPYFHDKSQAIVDSGFYPTETEQTFLAGFDTLIRVFNPKYYGSPDSLSEASSQPPIGAALGPLFRRARLRITMRPDNDWGSGEEQRRYVKELEGGRLAEIGGDTDWLARVDLVDGVGGAVSSSRARELVREGNVEELSGLVGERVRRWIDREGLYA